MIKNITLLLAACIFATCLSSYSQSLIRLSESKEIICYADHTNKNTRIFPVQRKRSNGRTQESATFEVEYVGFTPEAEEAFQAAVDIWAGLINSPVPIRVRASWESLESGVLGSAIWGDAFGNFTEAQKRNTFYPCQHDSGSGRK